jgi:hypothetical protein
MRNDLRGRVRRAAATAAVLVLWGCGGSSDVNVNSPTSCDGGRGPQVTGVVQLPDGRLAREGGMLERVAATVWSAAEAITGSVRPATNVRIELIEIRPEDVISGRDPGAIEVGSTRANGEYCIGLPEGTDVNVCRYMVRVGDTAAGTLTRAFVFSTDERIDIDFRSEATVRVIFEEIPPADLCTFSPGGIRGIYDAVAAAPGVATGDDIDEINAVATSLALADPGVAEAVADALEPTPGPPPTRAGTRTSTPAVPTPTSTRAPASATAARSRTATATSSPDVPATRTATATMPVAAPTRTPTNTPS